MAQSFVQRLRAAAEQHDSLVCVGLDPKHTLMPAVFQKQFGSDATGAIVAFNRAIIEATADLVCAYKPNLGFYLAYGVAGLQALVQTRALIPANIPVILDAKVNDMKNTSIPYAQGYFGEFGFDAVTMSPYMGADSLTPFLDYPNRGIFMLCHTSNPTASELQELPVAQPAGEPIPLYQAVAQQVATWIAQYDASEALGVVAGATYAQEIAAIRAILPTAPILIPGVGEQGGAIQDCVQAGVDATGFGVLVNASRSVTYASAGADFAAAARATVETMRQEINLARSGVAVG